MLKVAEAEMDSLAMPEAEEEPLSLGRAEGKALEEPLWLREPQSEAEELPVAQLLCCGGAEADAEGQTELLRAVLAEEWPDLVGEALLLLRNVKKEKM